MSIARAVAFVGVMPLVALMAWSSPAFALDPSLDASQYLHTVWKVRDGFTNATIAAIAQTPDGYLWLGTEAGLLRFDGVRTTQWSPPVGQTLPSTNISNLLVGRDGTLWIGTFQGLASWNHGGLTLYPTVGNAYIGRILDARDGSVWITRMVVGLNRWQLCQLRQGAIHCFGEELVPGEGALGVHEDRNGNLWVGTRNGVWRWSPGAPTFYPLHTEPNGILGFADSEDGALLIAAGGAIQRFVDGVTQPAYLFPASLRQSRVSKLLRDRDGGLWIPTPGGLMHGHQALMEVFTQADGLSGDAVRSVFEDREGTIWVSTDGGLDRFREPVVAVVSAKQGLSNSRVSSVWAAKDGSVWLGTIDGLNRWRNGQIGSYRAEFAEAAVQSIFEDTRGRIWLSTMKGLAYLQDERMTTLKGVPAGLTRAIAESAGGSLWISHQTFGLFHLSPEGEVVEKIPFSALHHEDQPSAMVADARENGLWLGFFQGGVVRFVDGQVAVSYSHADGLGDGRVFSLQLQDDGTLWVATATGLSRIKDGHVRTISSKHGLPCDAVQWSMHDKDGSLWAGLNCGLVKISRVDMDAWVSAVSKGGVQKQIPMTAFDVTDGIKNMIGASYFTSVAAKASSGKIWFVSQDGVDVIDPRRLPINAVLPPVHVEQITADRKIYDVDARASERIALPALTRDLQIDYTALSLVAPDKVAFKYKLEGRDRDWRDAGNRRQAFYDALPPGNYRFRVTAANNSGVWNDVGDFVDFSVAPASYQTAWFRLLAVAGFLALLAGAYQLRRRQLVRQFTIRLDERINERSRIARDFHDTLLQSFQGVLLKFHAVTYLLQDRPEAKARLEAVIEQARTALTEGRDAVQGLRATSVVTDLAQAIATLGEALAAEYADHRTTDLRLQVEGAARTLRVPLQDEVYRIAAEALRNAYRHAHAAHLEVDLRYDPREFRLRVRDDGKGMDPTVAAAGREGHFGMAGMQERAKLVGGKLAVWSELGSGTEVELTIPAPAAYS